VGERQRAAPAVVDPLGEERPLAQAGEFTERIEQPPAGDDGARGERNEGVGDRPLTSGEEGIRSRDGRKGTRERCCLLP
jgi:hypothetical protein